MLHHNSSGNDPERSSALRNHDNLRRSVGQRSVVAAGCRADLCSCLGSGPRTVALHHGLLAAGLTLGSCLWGWVAARQVRSRRASDLGRWTMVLAALAVRNFSLGSREAADLAPSYHWPHIHRQWKNLTCDRGPVLVTSNTRLRWISASLPGSNPATWGNSRRRDGAFGWGVFEDVASAGTLYRILPACLLAGSFTPA